MNKTPLVLLFAALFGIGTASATSTSPASCPPGATVISTGSGSTPSLSGTALCGSYSAPSGNVVTSVVVTIEGDLELPNGTGTFTYNFSVSNLSPSVR